MKSKLSSLLWAAIISIAVLFISLFFEVLHAIIHIPSWVTWGVLFIGLVITFYNMIYQKYNYYMVSYYCGIEKPIHGFMCFRSNSGFIPSVFQKKIKDELGLWAKGEEVKIGNVVITNVTELTKKEFELHNKETNGGVNS